MTLFACIGAVILVVIVFWWFTREPRVSDPEPEEPAQAVSTSLNHLSSLTCDSRANDMSETGQTDVRAQQDVSSHLDPA